MSTILRLMGWGWLMAGLLAVGSAWMAHLGVRAPVPQEVAASLSMPWSLMAPLMGLGPKVALLLQAVGIFINAQVLFVIANVLGD